MNRVRTLLNDNNREFTFSSIQFINNARREAKAHNWTPLFKAWGYDGDVISIEVETTHKPSDSVVRDNIHTYVDWMRELDASFGVNYRTTFKELYKPCLGDVHHEYHVSRIKRDFGIRTEGVKLTKVMSRVLDKVAKDMTERKPHIEAEVKRAIEKVGASMIERTETKTVKISLELFDYLRMSHGNSWDSCHSIRDGGSWQSGTISYAMDKVTAIAYIEASDGDKLASRCVLHLHPKGIIVGRCYGAREKETFIKAVQMLLETRSRVDEFEVVARRGGTAYPDWENDHYNTLIELKLPLGIGRDLNYSEPPLCINCGEVNDNCDSLVCGHCTHFYCPTCHEEIDEDDLIFLHSIGENGCPNCASRCNTCGEWYREGDMLHGTNRRGQGIEVCESCWDETQAICDDCGESMHIDLMYYHEGDGAHYCDGCISDHPENEEEIED